MENENNYEEITNSNRAKRKSILQTKDRYVRPPKKPKTSAKKTTSTPTSKQCTPTTSATPLVDITNIQSTPINDATTQPIPSQLNPHHKQKSCVLKSTTTINLIAKFSEAMPSLGSTSAIPDTEQPPTNLSDDYKTTNAEVDDASHDGNHENEDDEECDSNLDEHDEQSLSSDSDSEFQQDTDNFQIGNITFRGLYILSNYNSYIRFCLTFYLKC
ncbi:hypothetical protein QL285_008806 [Trifolium repens]|nr:hypothetical protein QL285_008806 [Trifolium repens]